MYINKIKNVKTVVYTHYSLCTSLCVCMLLLGGRLAVRWQRVSDEWGGDWAGGLLR